MLAQKSPEFEKVVAAVKRLSADFTDKVNSDSTIRLLEKVDKMYPSAGKIHIVLDNAAYYHSGLVRDWLSRHKRIKLMKELRTRLA